MKYLITEEQFNFLDSEGMSKDAKPIEPLSAKETHALVGNWFADEWAQVQAIGLLRDYEAHILGEKHDSE